MSLAEPALRPHEFADAARAAITDAMARPPADRARVLAQAGLAGVCAREQDGGLGLPLAFAVPVAQAAGELHLPWALPEQLLLARHLAGTPHAAPLVAGEKTATIAWQGELRAGCVGPARHARDCDWALVPERTPQGLGAALIDLRGVQLEEDAALDPEEPQQWLRLQGPQVLARLDAHAHAQLLRDAQVLLAALAHGAAAGALQAAVTHLSTRVQFGRPLSAKQAVRHWLARMTLLQEVSGAAIERALSVNEFGQPRSARAVLAGSLHNAAFVIEKAIHLHGGMGFTWALPLHRALRDVRKLDAAFGAGALAREIGREFIEGA